MTRTRGLPGKGFDQALQVGAGSPNAAEARAILEAIGRHLLAADALARWQAGWAGPNTPPSSSLIIPAPGNLDRPPE